MSDPAFEDLKTVRAADVYKSGRLAAVLRRTSQGVVLHYEDDYLSGEGQPLATTLPLTDEPTLTGSGAVPPYFAGLLPEGRRLSGLRRAIKTSADDEFSLLLAVGSDAIGDVQVVPEGDPPVRAEPVVQVAKSWSEVRFVDVMGEAGVIDPVALPGVQDKVSARMISVSVKRAGERYILKVDPPEFPHVVENEAYFLSLARRARLEAAHAEVVHDSEGRPGLLVRRFDRLADPSGASVALACEDACQVMGLWPADKYNVTSERVVTALANLCPAKPVALRDLFGQLCYAWLTGNGDVHAKNLAVLATPDGEWRVSPAYDLPSTVPYADRSLALPIGGKTRGISRRRLLEFAAVVGLPARAAAEALDDLLDRLSGLEEELHDGALPFTDNVTIDLIKELRYRRRQVEP